MPPLQGSSTEHGGDEFKNVMFADRNEWRQEPMLRDYEGMVCYCRGDPLGDPHVLVCHGCPLSVVWNILRNGFLVGNGHHQKNGTRREGIFCVSSGGLFERLLHARDRSTTSRDTEWRFGLGGWSTPCVLAFPAPHATQLGRIGNCQKSCIRHPPGSTQELPQGMMLCFMRAEFLRYRSFPSRCSEYMMRGGREHGGRMEPLYWAGENNTMPPSCGRTCPLPSLHAPGSTWVKTKAGHI